MKQEHHPEQAKNVHKGVNKHISDPVAADSEDGYVNESLNTSPNIEGFYGARKKIEGETILYENGTLEDYTNLGSLSIGNDIVELWGGATEGLIRINGVIRCQSANLPLRNDDKIIAEGNANVIGGEIYISNRRTAPFVLSVIDMKSPADPEDFFENFLIEKYDVNLRTPLNRMAFIELVPLGGGSGVPNGSYSYSAAYVTKAGDRTNWSQETPVIPVISKNQKSENYPTSRILGGVANTNIPSGFGVKLKFRVVNDFEFDYIEIKRTPYNNGAGNNFVPTQEIIARLDITKNQVEVITFVDGRDNNIVPSIPLAPDQTINGFSEIEKANALHYKNRRLHLLGVEYASRELSAEFIPGELLGNTADPYIHKIYKEGHSDPYNATYFKSHMRGEKRSFAFGGFDGMGGAGLAMKIEALQNYQFPERRTILNTETDALSFTNGRGVATATRLEDNVAGRCHEVFDIADAQNRGLITPHNIAVEGGKTGTSYDAEKIGYKPLRPASINDPYISDHEARISETVDKEGYVGSDEVNYNPQGFSPDYYSLGLAIHGVDTTSLPSWVKSFSILQSEPAQRVIAQGIGVYAMTEEGSSGSATVKKERKKVWFYSTDMNAGAVSSELIQDMISNPSSYSVQLVSPLGFFSEVYHGDYDAVSDDSQIDFISFARCLNNEESVNPGITTGYTKFGAWRNDLLGTNPVANSDDKIFDIVAVSKIIEGRGEYYEIEVDSYIYDTYYTGGGREFIDDDVKAWHEPFYIVNIVQNSKQIPDSNIMSLTSTGLYQKLSSVIGVSNGSDNQDFELVDERYEDCCVDFYSSTKTTDNAYLFIVDAAGNEEVWMDVTYRTVAARNAILSAMNIVGEISTAEYPSVVGVYTHEVVNDRFYTIKFQRFNAAYPTGLFIPDAESRIFVKYDSSKPLKVFGGDVFIGESIFSPIDKEIVKVGSEEGENNCFKLNVGMPYYKFILDVDYFIVKNADGGAAEKIQDGNELHLSLIRQWCVMFTSESRSPVHLKYGNAFPAVHYVMRPIEWDQKNLSANFAGSGGVINNSYRNDYPGEEFLWGYGGFKFEEKMNSDHASKPVTKFFSRPEVAFEEETKFPSRDHYSALRGPQQKNSPGVRSFPPLNIFDLDDKQGGLKFGTSMSTTSDTMYVFAERGIAELLVGKNVIQDATGGVIGYLLANNIVQREEWRSRVIGVKKDLYQTIQQNDKNQLIFLSNEGMKKFDGSNIIDISGGYKKELMHLVKYGSDSRLSSMYKIKDGEYWLRNRLYGSIGGQIGLPTVRVFCDNENSPANGDWIGKFGFQEFDGFLYHNTGVYGFKNMETYELLSGTTISDSPIESYVDIFFGKITNKEKEFIRFMIESDVKPERVEFYFDDVLQCSVDMSNIKDYGTFEQFIPRKDSGVSTNRDRVQYNFVKMRIVHNLEQDFVLRTATIQYKLLK